ncbi:MAG: hypothetical protein JKY46_08045 [Robiginitomaculum sp.]|nr:hypothetical protein [Robiginitomaculum sp.]
MRNILLTSIAVLALGNIATPSFAEEADSLSEAITKGKASLTFRYRAEGVEQVGFAKDAFASTLRTRLKLSTLVYKGFSGVLEVDNVTNLGATGFNSTVNGKTTFPVIADPEITEINQAYLAYTGIEKTTLLAGRVAHNIGNQRFVGTVGWRQNDQTWDMAAMINSSIPDLTITGAYVWNVNRIFGNDHPFGDLDTNSFIFDARYSGLPFGNLAAYALVIDLNDPAVYGLSSKTYGLRFDGKQKIGNGNASFIYEAEYAVQSDNADNPTNFSTDYFLLSGGIVVGGLTAKIGFEQLGSDNGIASFQTPLATLHKFNGWADKFLGTPVNGLEDLYFSLSYKVQGDGAMKGLKFDAIYHDFSADVGNGSYGTEVDLQVSKKFMEHYSFGLKYANYQADGFGSDTQKYWFSLGAAF